MARTKPLFDTLVLLFGAACLLMGCAHCINANNPKQEAVENGLLPAIVPAGRPLAAWSLEERMARYNVPGVSIALIDEGKIAWTKGYGVTRMHGTEPVSPSTLFQAASLVKIVTATGALRLVQEKGLSLDGDVNEFLRNWKVPANAYTEKTPVTLRGLLSHSAGVTVEGFPGYAHNAALPSLRQILDGVPPANSPPIRVDAIPGSIHRYSGGGYMIVQQLVEDQSKKAFSQWAHEKVLSPVGMVDSTFMQRLPDDRRVVAACGHGFDGMPVKYCGNIYPEISAAWLWSTPTDMAHLGIALSDSLRGRPDTILSQATARLMLTKGIGDMGLGSGVHGTGNGLHFDHAGWNRGFRAYMVVYPYLGKGAVVMANGNGGDTLIDEIVRSIAKTYQWPDFAPQRRTTAAIEPAELDNHTGEYEVREYGIVLSVTRKSDYLIVQTPRGSSWTFYPASDDEYFAIEDGSELTFTKAAGSEESVLRVWGMTALRRFGQ